MSDRPLSRRVVPELGPPGAVQIDSVGGDVAGTRIGDVYELARRIHSYRDGTSSNRFSANLELRRALADADPRDVRARGRMAFAYLRVAETLAKMGEPVAAMEYSRHALSIAEALRTANPEDVISLAQVAEAHVRIGDAEVDLGRKTSRDQLSRAEHHRKACASYRMALKSYRELEQRRVAEEWDQENAQHVAQQVALCAPN